MAYIARQQVGEVIQPMVIDGLFGEETYESLVMEKGTRLNVGTKETIIPIVATSPTAEFVEKTGEQATPIAGTYPAVDVEDAPDIGFKPVSNLTLGANRLILEKVAVIIPVSDCVLEDLPDAEAFVDLIRREGSKACAKRFDEAAVLGINAPATYGAGIIPTAIARDNVVDITANADAITRVNALSTAMGEVEEDGYDVDGIAVDSSWRAVFRTLPTSTAGIIYQMNEITNKIEPAYDGIPLTSAKILKGTNYKALVGDYSKLYWGVRNEYEVTQSNEATLINADGTTLNLFQQDMTAFRILLRIGYTVMTTNNSDYPFAVVRVA